jgi:excinuclease ABC subunit C
VPAPAWRPASGEIPDAPGVYRFRDPSGRVVYVGKAKSLRQRLNSYFADPLALHPRTASMVAAAAALDWVVVDNEVEALQLEYSWIKEYDPRFNVKYRDDKSYPFLAITFGEEYPRAMVVRGAKRKGTRYFGPYAHAWAIRETLDLLLRVFPMRTCSPGVFRRAKASNRPCLLADIGKCSAPCVGRVSAEDHRLIALDLADFLAGRHEPLLEQLTVRMKQAAAVQDYETAARYRDDVGAVTRALERSAVVLADGTDADVFGLAEDDLEASVQVFHVRGGRVAGQRGFVLEKTEELAGPTTVETAIIRHYGNLAAGGQSAAEAIPREILVPQEPSGGQVVAAWLSGLRGRQVRIRVPKRGEKRALLDTVTRNADHALVLHKTRRSGDLTARSKALADLMEVLELPQAPLRIECFDVSHLGGTDPVASMVVFEDGLAKPSQYRTFALRDAAGGDDLSGLREVVARRYRRLTDRAAEPDGSFSYEPSLVMVDGGAPQVNAAAEALQQVGIGELPVIGLAKRLEEVWLPDEPDPVILPRASDALYLLQRVRDEAHRFAITAQRRARAKRVKRSALDDIPGLGPARRSALLRVFGSVKAVRAASPEEIATVPGIGPALAATIHRALAEPGTAGVASVEGASEDPAAEGTPS